MRSWPACLFLTVLFPLLTRAQLTQQFRLTNYNASTGLPEEMVNSAIQDSRGFLWIGTRESLIRYDGLRKESWYANPSDSTRFYNNNITVLGEDGSHHIIFLSGAELWEINIINLRLNRVERYRGKYFHSIPVKLSNGHWFLNDQDSLFLAGQKLLPFIGFRKKTNPAINRETSCFELQFPYLLLYGGFDNQMIIFDRNSHSFFPINVDNRMLDDRVKFFIPQAYDSLHQRIYFSAFFNGMYYCDLRLPVTRAYRPEKLEIQSDGTIRKSVFLPEGLLLQGGDNDLYLTDFKTSIGFRKDHLTEEYDRGKIITNIQGGQGNSYWLSSNKGLMRLDLGAPVINYTAKQFGFNSDDEFKSIIRTEDGSIYLLTQEKSLFRLNTKTKEVTRLDSSLLYGWSAIRLGDQILAAGGGKKLISYSLTDRKIRYPDFLEKFYSGSTDLVTLLFKAKNGDLWMSCNGSGGLIHNLAGTAHYEQFSRNSPGHPISLHYVHTAAEDSHGNIWFATNKSERLLRWDKALNSFSEFQVGSLVPQYTFNTGVNNLYIDPDDNLWIALDGAALLCYNLNSKSGKYFDINSGLPSNEVFSITSDARNRIWCGTSRGLICILPQSGKVVVFTEYDGLPDNNVEGRGILYDSSSNLLFTGGRRSLAWFDPDQLINQTVSVKPSLYITEMKVNSQTYYFDEATDIRLKPFEKNIAFTIAVPDYYRNNQLIFQYHLTGSGNDWVNLGTNRNVTFYDLPHGRYRFSVRCRYTGSDTWYETATPFSFRIRTPWNKTGWFRLCLALLFLTMIFFLIRFYYRRKMEKQYAILEKEIAIEQERTKMARELHDGLGSMLSGIKHSFSAMTRDLDLSGKQETIFHDNLNKLNESILELRNITHNMASDALLKYGLENSLRDYCQNTSTATGIPIGFHALSTENLKLEEDRSYHVFRIVQELLQNIIKHAAATQVLVQLSFNKNHLYLTVEDNGRGFDLDTARKKKSLGLKNIESRVRLLKGELDLQTSPGNGCSVLITIPVS